MADPKKTTIYVPEHNGTQIFAVKWVSVKHLPIFLVFRFPMYLYKHNGSYTKEHIQMN